MTTVTDGDVQPRTLGELVAARAHLGTKQCFRCEAGSISYGELDDASDRVATALRDMGVGKGDVVASLMYNAVEQMPLWFGCAKLGAIWASFNVSLKQDDLRYSIVDSRARVVVVDAELAGLYEAACAGLERPPRLVVHGPSRPGATTLDALLDAPAERPDAEVGASDPAAIIYTGGSTGMPKGVLIPHGYYIEGAVRYGLVTQATADDVHFACSHFFHLGGQQFGVVGPMLASMTGSMARWFSASGYWPAARRHGATIIDPIGTMLPAILAQPEQPDDADNPARIGVGVASGQIRREVRDRFEERFGVTLLEVYGLTEMGTMIFSETLSDRRPRSSGRCLGWHEVKIVDASGEEVPAGSVGHVVIRPSRPNTGMLGFWGKPETIRARARNEWHRTGDLAAIDEDGYFFFAGREAHWIRRRGENLSAFEVERVITAHPAVAECAVVGVPSELGEEDVKAYVQVRAGEQVPPEEIVAWCEERLAFFKCPRYIEFVDDFARSAAKAEIMRHELRALGVGDAWDRDAAMPRGSVSRA